VKLAVSVGGKSQSLKSAIDAFTLGQTFTVGEL